MLEAGDLTAPAILFGGLGIHLPLAEPTRQAEKKFGFRENEVQRVGRPTWP